MGWGEGGKQVMMDAEPGMMQLQAKKKAKDCQGSPGARERQGRVIAGNLGWWGRAEALLTT